MKLWMAPMHGINNYSFRNLWMSHFSGIDKTITPFISLMDQRKIKPNRLIDFFPENNPYPIVPQVIGNNSDQLITMTESLFELGYTQLNLNLGCPASQVMKHRRGAGLMLYPEIIDALLWSFFNRYSQGLSVKIRIGLKSTKDIYPVLEILNKYPLDFVCIHPRLASQMYEGVVNLKMMQECVEILKHPIIYSGDIKKYDDIEKLARQFPTIEDWMIGRQLIVNPFLAEEIKLGKQISTSEKRNRFIEFHEKLVQKLVNDVEQEKSALNKLKEYWTYFSQNKGVSEKDLFAFFRSNELTNINETTKKMLKTIEF